MSDTGYFESVSANLKAGVGAQVKGISECAKANSSACSACPYCSWQKGATKEHRQTHKAIRAGKNGLYAIRHFLSEKSTGQDNLIIGLRHWPHGRLLLLRGYAASVTRVYIIEYAKQAGFVLSDSGALHLLNNPVVFDV